ncbi:MAG TPA: glycosyltransferase family A protein [Solirubrobacterales bacterium]|nr:glycosyltransferase family A protein [Solirubrobacterales bacterium]
MAPTGQMSPAISVVTPSYQRAATLPRLYESLVAQSCVDFEWVVVDDGSDDGTVALVRGWEREGRVPIRYAWQPNAGKHSAFNHCVRLARGRFCALIDSDDWYVPEALERMLACWDSIPVAARNGFANVEGLRLDADGHGIGDRYPADPFDSDTFERVAVHGLGGDTVGMYRRDVLLEFPFPEDLGWHVSPDLVWNRIAARYATRFVNEYWAYTDYQEGGLSARTTELRTAHPLPQLLYWTEFAAMPRRMPRSARLRAHANRGRYWFWAGRPRGRLLEGASAWWALATLPLGLGLFLFDRWRLRKTGAPA